MFIWTIGDAIGLTVLAVLIIIWLIHLVTGKWKQARCAHEKVWIMSGGQPVCRHCRKKLRFKDKEK